MNIASALIKQVIALQDFETWSRLRKHYLPSEYDTLYKVIDSHCDKYHQVPTFDDLRYEIRDGATRDRLYAIEGIEVEAEPLHLLEYLKNEYAQREILGSLETYIDQSVAFEDADESLAHLHQIVLDVENKVELQDPEENMQYIQLFDPDEEVSKYLPLGLNSDYDDKIKFSPRDLILVGGRRGSGKSITCANLANNVFNSGKSAIYFTIEMDSRQTLQRCAAIATGIPFSRLKLKNLNVTEWEKVAGWWANRFTGGAECLKDYKQHRDFEKFHRTLTSTCELLPTQQLDVVYDPSLTISKIKAELDKKVKSLNVGVVIVDYINQVKRSALPSRGGQYDWTEQIEVSKALKAMAQEFEVPIFSPYQTDASGEARFAKGILDAADAAYALETWNPEDNCITFNCVKMRNNSMDSFTSTMQWDSLKIGPESSMSPKDAENSELKSGESIDDL